MKADDLDKKGLVQFPTVIGGVVPIVNLEGVAAGALVLDGATLAKIYLGAKAFLWTIFVRHGLMVQTMRYCLASYGSHATAAASSFMVRPRWELRDMSLPKDVHFNPVRLWNDFGLEPLVFRRTSKMSTIRTTDFNLTAPHSDNVAKCNV